MKLPVFLLAAGLLSAAVARAAAPDLDLGVAYYSRVLTPEGVTRESRYEEKMLRRAGHVWTARVLPGSVVKDAPGAAEAHRHKEFNHVALPRHVIMENNKVRLEYVDAHERQVIAIPASEYENVNFDGSWVNSFHLLDPKLVAAMPLSSRASAVAGARWRELEKNGVFQRVLWDEQKQIPLAMENGDRAGTFYRRVDVKLSAPLVGEPPWNRLQGYGRKEYADFLD